MTYEEMFRMQWEYMAENPGTSKQKAIRELKFPLVNDSCFACATIENKLGYVDCIYCPVKWWKKRKYKKTYAHCTKAGNIYRKWYLAFKREDYKKACELALKISKLPWEAKV